MAKFAVGGMDIKKKRLARNLTQVQLAHLVGVTPFTICRWEKGKHKPSPLAQAKLDIVLGKDVGEVEGEKGLMA